MALDSVSDEWMYNEVLDDELAEVTNNDNAVRRVSIDSTDLLDDVLTLPSSTTKQISEPEDLNFLQEAEENGVPMEDSASPRFNADKIAKTVQARIESNKTSQSFSPSQLLTIYSRDPNKKNSIFIGNMTWWTTDIDILSAVKEVGLGDVKCLKFFENRTNGQSKGYALIELSSEAVALGAPDKLQTLSLHGKNLMAAYAGRMTAAQFEGKCQGKALPEKTITTTKGKTPQIYNKPPAGGFPQPPLMLPGALRPNDVPLPFNPPFSLPPPMGPGGFDPTGIGSGFIKPPVAAAPHLNPAFLQDMSTGGGNVAELFAKAAAHFQTNSTVKSRHSEEEIADANQRNRAISSSAISRAMSDANSGDYDSAIDTLKMAITLIKQSITAGSESSQMLIQSLQDCLNGIEHQSGNKRSYKTHHDKYEGGRDKRSSGRSSGSNNTKHRDRSRERRR